MLVSLLVSVGRDAPEVTEYQYHAGRPWLRPWAPLQKFASDSAQLFSAKVPTKELESSPALLHAASRLQAIKDSWEGKTPEFDDALLYNRRLWTVFLSSVTRPDNPLPAEIRQNVANLGLFVLKSTMSLLLDPRPEKLESLME